MKTYEYLSTKMREKMWKIFGEQKNSGWLVSDVHGK